MKSLLLIACTVLALCSMVTYKKTVLNRQRAAYAREQMELEDKISALEKDKEEIEEYKDYTQTKKYVEEIARDKLHLIYPGEIVFEPGE